MCREIGVEYFFDLVRFFPLDFSAGQPILKLVCLRVHQNWCAGDAGREVKMGVLVLY